MLSQLLFVASAALADGTCTAWSAPEEVGRVGDADLVEASGVASSWQGDVLWAHNDAGNGPVLHALGLDGSALGRVTVLGATNTDWEDVATGPCDAACSCLYVGDIGDDGSNRSDEVIWRLAEPSPSDGQTTAEALPFVYPDGPHDAEALLVDPITGEVLVVTREVGIARVYAFPDAPPEPSDTPVELELVGTIDLSALGADGEVTAGDVSPGGGRVALRTNGDVLLFTAPDGGGAREALMSAYTLLPAPDVPDGEALAFSRDGRSLWLLHEGDDQLWEIGCAQFDDDGEVPCEAGPPGEGCGCGGSGSEGLLPLVALLWRRQPRSGRRR